LEQHLSKLGGEYTKQHGVKGLVYLEEFENLDQARQREIQIKGWARVKKERLINGKWGKEW
jgi:predicted GIY-YIG superfamily endonuclease